MNHRSRTHHTRLQRDIHIAIFKPPVADGFGRLGQCQNLGVTDCIVFSLLAIAACADHLAVLYDNAPDGHFVLQSALFCQLNRHIHKLFVV